MDKVARRPIRARESRWAAAVARWLIQLNVQPNQISLSSVLFAALAGASLVVSRTSVRSVSIALLVAAALFIQLRLLCNLLDGMLAIEGALKTKLGEIFNELPDRLSDVFILVCAGYSVPPPSWAPELGWAAAVLAVMTAYVRAFGAAVGTRQYYCGPMAKQARMFVMTLACFGAIIEIISDAKPRVMTAALALIVAGCAATIARRTVLVAKEVASR